MWTAPNHTAPCKQADVIFPDTSVNHLISMIGHTDLYLLFLEVMMIQGFLLAHEYDIQSDMFNICPAT